MSENAPQAQEIQGDDGTPAPRRGRPSIDLSTPQGVLGELERLYRDARFNRIKVERATKLVFILNSCLRAHEVVSLERRVAALEGDDGPQLIDPNPDV